MLRTIATAIVAICLFQPVWAKGPCTASWDVPNAYGIPIAQERILRVPDSQQAAALSLLGAKSFSPLSQSKVEDLLAPERRPASETMLSKQANDAEEKAALCRDMASKPWLANLKESLLSSAAAYDEYAAYTRSLSNNLHPYLVKAQVLFECSGTYSAFLRDHQLRLFHGSLGRGPKEPKNVAVIVFVESDVDNVDVRYSAAE